MCNRCLLASTFSSYRKNTCLLFFSYVLISELFNLVIQFFLRSFSPPDILKNADKATCEFIQTSTCVIFHIYVLVCLKISLYFPACMNLSMPYPDTPPLTQKISHIEILSTPRNFKQHHLRHRTQEIVKPHTKTYYITKQTAYLRIPVTATYISFSLSLY